MGEGVGGGAEISINIENREGVGGGVGGGVEGGAEGE